MAEQRIHVEGRDGGILGVNSEGNIGAVPATFPGAKFYFHSLLDAAGVVASNNFMSIFNPVTSNRLVVFFQAEISSYATGVSASTASLTATRITAASDGSLISGANINRFVTSDPNPQAETRVGNPTVTTVGLPLNGWIPPISSGAGVGSTAYTSTPPGAGFVCAPGQGIVFNTAAGNVNQVWKILSIWAEIPF